MPTKKRIPLKTPTPLTNNTLAQALASRLSTARARKHILQSEAAIKLGIPRSALSKIETNERTVSAIEILQLADLYRQDLATLLSRQFTELDRHWLPPWKHTT